MPLNARPSRKRKSGKCRGSRQNTTARGPALRPAGRSSPADSLAFAPPSDEAAQRLLDFLEVSCVWVWESDDSHRFTFVSSTDGDLAETEASPLIGRRPWELVGVDPRRDPAWRLHMGALEARQPFRDFRYSFVDSRGRRHHWKVSGKPIFGPDNAFRGYRGTATDETRQVDARTQAEDAALQTNAHLRAIVDHAPAIIYLKDCEGRYTLINRAFEQTYGVVNADVIGKTAAEIFPGIGTEPYSRTDREVLRTGRPVEQDLDDPYDESGRVLHVIKFPVVDADGAIVAIGGVETNVTERRRAEKDFREQRRQLDIALDNMMQGLTLYDSDQRLVLCNQRYLDVYGISPEVARPGVHLRELMEHSVRVGNYEPDIAEAAIRDRLTLASNPQRGIVHQYLSDGRIIEVVHRPLPDGGNVATCTDVTEVMRAAAAQRAAREQAELASRAKSEFLANMSHELRTPLNAIIGFSEIMRDRLLGPLGAPQYHDYVAGIHESGSHLLSLINDILDISKIEAGKLELEEGPIDVEQLVCSALTLVQARADDAGLSIEIELDDELPQLRADLRAMKQILLNLLTNAVKFTPAGGRIAIRAKTAADGRPMLSVADTGIGIASNDLRKALAPFGQIDGPYARNHQGTGLGLPLAKSLAELHGGSLEIESQPGLGTTVRVYLPAERIVRC
ncbi:MAG: PAS-domain containing protein [Alphaproteobacteria bacterium]|nr:PAS-domain containing protein [Alphaproteobacteria bacterium]